jgi:WD40 repeat protein
MMVFSPKTRFAIMKKRHKAAVKAIAWSDKQRGVLASGGGTADCMIKIWNIGNYFYTVVFFKF